MIIDTFLGKVLELLGHFSCFIVGVVPAAAESVVFICKTWLAELL